MGKKSKRRTRQSSSGIPRREKIEARHDVVRSSGSDPRAEADRLRENFLRLSEDGSMKWDPRRIWLITEYRNVMFDAITMDNYNGVNFATKEDIKFIKSVSRNSMELAYIRAAVTKLWMVVASANLEEEDSYQCIHRCIKICSTASEMEKLFSIGEACLGGCIKEMAESCQRILDKYRSYARGDSLLRQWDEEASEDDHVKNRDVRIMGCDICLVCGKTYEDVGVPALDCCQRCQLTYYCSRECQLKDWKQHKKVCRKPGEFKIGDMVVVADPSNEQSPFGQWAVIMMPEPDDPR